MRHQTTKKKHFVVITSMFLFSSFFSTCEMIVKWILINVYRHIDDYLKRKKQDRVHDLFLAPARARKTHFGDYRRPHTAKTTSKSRNLKSKRKKQKKRPHTTQGTKKLKKIGNSTMTLQQESTLNKTGEFQVNSSSQH